MLIGSKLKNEKKGCSFPTSHFLYSVANGSPTSSSNCRQALVKDWSCAPRLRWKRRAGYHQHTDGTSIQIFTQSHPAASYTHEQERQQAGSLREWWVLTHCHPLGPPFQKKRETNLEWACKDPKDDVNALSAPPSQLCQSRLKDLVRSAWHNFHNDHWSRSRAESLYYIQDGSQTKKSPRKPVASTDS